MFCSECGTRLEKTAKFCYSCGFKMIIPAAMPAKSEELAVVEVAPLTNNVSSVKESSSIYTEEVVNIEQLCQQLRSG